MEIIKEDAFRKQLKKGLSGAYLFFGEEDYLKNLAVTYAREALVGDPSLACFNEIILDALDFHPEKLRSALMSFPMMADRKVILVRGLDLNAMKTGEFDLLCEVLSELSEYDYNVLIISVPSGLIEEGNLPKYKFFPHALSQRKAPRRKSCRQLAPFAKRPLKHTRFFLFFALFKTQLFPFFLKSIYFFLTGCNALLRIEIT